MGGVNKYRGILHCLQTSVATEGVSGLFRGLNSALIRAFPTNAATFAVVTWTMKAFQGHKEEDETNQSWRDILRKGETLVQAAAIPETMQLSLTSSASCDTANSFLPQVMAASKAELHEEVQEHETICQCWRRHGSSVIGKLPGLVGSVCKCHEAFSSWRTRGEDVFASARLHHNLSIVL